MYKYIGSNGTFLTSIQINTTDKIELVEIKAEQGKILTDGIERVYYKIILKDELNLWQEIDDEGQE
jgi:hypothetical protein